MPAPAAARPPRPVARRRPRYVRAPQMELDLEPEGTIDQRFAWAKATAANYEEWAAKESDPPMRARLERRAAAWGKTVLDLIEKRKDDSRQLDLFAC